MSAATTTITLFNFLAIDFVIVLIYFHPPIVSFICAFLKKKKKEIVYNRFILKLFLKKLTFKSRFVEV